MRILYTSDLHGRTDLYQEIIILSIQQKINAVVLGGDLFPKQGRFIDSLEIQMQFIEDLFCPFLIELKDRTGASIYCILGNDDWAATLPLLHRFESDRLVHLLDHQVFQLSDGWSITGYPYVPPTPFSPKDFEKRDLKNDSPIHTTDFPAVSRSGLIEKIDEVVYFSRQSSIEEDMILLPRIPNHQKAVYVIHAPPYDTALDRLGKGRSIGSKAIRHFINKEQPSITLHGHIHESPMVSGFYWQKIGETLSINPGQMGSRLSAVILDSMQPMETLSHTRYGNVQSHRAINSD
ncbi:metallophosphoesterase [bacterium]|nr:metallophosphoesterase [bacterium]RQV96321.1 MAG: metallophosphoesterase [bacterium]